MYTGKELQTGEYWDASVSTGLEMYDFEARFFDPQLGRWFVPDPAEQFSNPYLGIGNNPVYYLDPSGRNAIINEADNFDNEDFVISGSTGGENDNVDAANDENDDSESESDDIDGILDIGIFALPPDDYSVDKDGNLTLEKRTSDNFDMLYTKEDYEGKKEDGIQIDDRTILPKLKKGNHTTAEVTVGSESVNDVYKAFLFLARHTNVEWSVYRSRSSRGMRFTLATLHSTGFSPAPSKLGISENNVASFVHSHPDRSIGKMESMGVWETGPRGDWLNVRTNVNPGNSGQKFPYYVFFPASSELYSIDYSGPSYIRSIRNDFNRFYFGTLK